MTKRLHHGERPAEILLIDDNRGDALLAARAFHEAETDTRLTFAPTGEIAMAILQGELEYFGHRLPDLVLLDLSLPKMNGLEVLAAIKDRDRLKHIPVIVMSSSGDERNILGSYRAQAAAYIPKPGDMAAYRQTIARIEQFFFLACRLPAVDS